MVTWQRVNCWTIKLDSYECTYMYVCMSRMMLVYNDEESTIIIGWDTTHYKWAWKAFLTLELAGDKKYGNKLEIELKD